MNWDARLHLQKLVNEANDLLHPKQTTDTVDAGQWEVVARQLRAALRSWRDPDGLSTDAQKALLQCDAKANEVKNDARAKIRKKVQEIRSKLATSPKGVQLWTKEVRELHQVIAIAKLVNLPEEEVASAEELIAEIEKLESDMREEVQLMKRESEVIEAFWTKDEAEVRARLESMRPSALKTTMIQEDLPRLTQFLSAKSDLAAGMRLQPEIHDHARRRIDQLEQAIKKADLAGVPSVQASMLLQQ